LVVVGDHQHPEENRGKQACQGPNPRRCVEIATPCDLQRERASAERRDGSIDDHKQGGAGVVGAYPAAAGHDEIACNRPYRRAEEAREDRERQSTQESTQPEAGECANGSPDQQDNQ
jgi:hypothetical protein